ncbi:MAG: Smr/MutS family protein, partial [Aequoribacter sp.]
RELDAVQAFHSAQPQHGGTGAVYILLRKNEIQKQVNRERFMRY